MGHSISRALAATVLLIGLAACRPAPTDPQPTNRIDRLRPVSIASIRNGQAPAAIVVTQISPSLVHADVTVTDILQPDFGLLGAGDPDRIRVTIRFSAPDLVGSRTPIRFNLPATSIQCHSTDPAVPPTRLLFQTDRYTAIVPKGRHLQDGLPSHVTCNMRAGETDYQIATMPLVYAVRMTTPGADSVFSPFEEITASLESESYEELWSNNNRHAMFRHDKTITTTERAADGTERIVGGSVRLGTPTFSQDISASPIAPFATSGSTGYVYAMTRYEPDEYTLGPSHFILNWTSISGASPVRVRWR